MTDGAQPRRLYKDERRARDEGLDAFIDVDTIINSDMRKFHTVAEQLISFKHDHTNDAIILTWTFFRGAEGPVKPDEERRHYGSSDCSGNVGFHIHISEIKSNV